MKKVLFSLILCLVMLMGLCAFAAAAEVDLGGYEMAESKEHCPGMGDVNFDGAITSADARLILRQAVALERFTDKQKAVADLDGNAMINSADARLALRIAVKLDKQLPHSTEDVLITEATCSSQGVIVQLCIACNEVVSYSTTSVSGHLAGNWVTVKQATCSEKGLQQKICTICEKVLEERTTTASHIFKFEDSYKGADCMNVVYAKQTCTKCGLTQTKAVNPIGKHSFTWVTTTPATCSKQGVAEYMCSVCGDKGNGQTKTVSCTGTKVEQTVKAPTCTQTGLSAKVCYVCGEKEDEKVIPATKHEYNENAPKVIKEPTHLEKGVAKVSCKKCGATKNIDIERLSHTTEDTGVVVKAPTCGEEGIKKVKCTYCGVVEAPIPATGNHTKSETRKTIKAATCTENKVTSYYCTVCGKYEGIYKSVTEENSKLPHTPAGKWTQTKAPTCTKEGTKVKYCSVCNGVALTEKVAKLPHTPTGDWVETKAATCSAKGEKVRYCSVCGNAAEKADIAKKAHTPASTKTVITKATCTAQGVKAVLCTVCREPLSTEIIPMKDHTPGTWRTVSTATCSKAGEKVKLCTVCKSIAVTKVIPATGNHKYPTTWITTTFATCVSQGEARRYCTNAGCEAYATKTLAVNPENHTTEETYKLNEAAATCSQEGYTGDIYHSCCNALKESGTPIEKPAHNVDGVEMLIESFGTVNEDGTISAGIKCKRCTVCSGMAESEDFIKFEIIEDIDSLFKALPDSSLANNSDAVLYFEINGSAENEYDVLYTYDGMDTPFTDIVTGGTILSIDLSAIPEDAVITIAVATHYPD